MLLDNLSGPPFQLRCLHPTGPEVDDFVPLSLKGNGQIEVHYAILVLGHAAVDLLTIHQQ